MNRMEEYRELMAELGAVAVPDGAVERAMRRDRRRRQIVRPLATMAAVFALFVVLVNCSTTVAYACSRVPGLRELAAAVTFSRSLRDAVDNEYVQPVNLEQTDGDITVSVEYLIVDQKNVTVFYRLRSKRYARLEAIPEFRAADGSFLERCSYGPNDWDVPNGELRSMTVDFVDDDVPPAMLLRLRLRDMGASFDPAPESSVWDDPAPPAPEDYVADFEFLLEFDPYFTAQGKHFTVDQSVALDGRTLHITNIDVYPSYLELTVAGDEANSAWLKSLDFYLVTDKGDRFDRGTGVISWGDGDAPDASHYRIDSTYFYAVSSLTLYFTGAEWLDKDTETIHVDLKSKTADPMPEGSVFFDAEREGNRWVVTVLHQRGCAQTFMNPCYDAAGNPYELRAYTSGATHGGDEAPEGYVFESFPLSDYPYDEVWLTPRYTSRWATEVPVAVTVDLTE